MKASDNHIGDVTILFAYLKAIDPNSVVRPGEVELTNPAMITPVLASIINTFEDITDKKSPSFGRRLLGTKRKEILGELKNLSRSAQKGFDYQRKRYSDIADSFSVDFNAVVYDPFKAGMIDRIEDYVASEKPNGKKEAAKKTPRKKLDLTDVPREIKDEDGSIWTLVPGASNEAGQPVYRNSKTNRFGFKRE